MNEEQAIGIFLSLLEAADALDEAEASAAPIAGHDPDAASIRALSIKLNAELLDGILDCFQVLFPDISLRWDQIQRPSAVSAAQLDEIIFSVVPPRWRKMALIIWDLDGRADEVELVVTQEMFVARIQALIEADRLDCRGDPHDWRSYEVRLKP